jgi:flagellin
MGLDIQTNTMATDASRNLSINESNMQTALQELSSGYQINKAADNPAGLVISQHLQAQIGGFQQAQANTQSAVNVVQTADGALNEVGNILQSISGLAVQSANTSATDATAQQAAQAEVAQSLSSITAIAATTVFGSSNLLTSGNASSLNYTFQVGYDGSSASQVTFSLSALTLANLGLVSNSLTNGSGGSSFTNGISSVGGNIGQGSYNLSVTGGTAATAATLTGTTYAAPSTPETVSFSIDGTSVSANLAASSTATATVTALNSAYDTAVGGGSTASPFATNSSGNLVVTSPTTGTNSSISLTGSGWSSLGFGTGDTSSTGAAAVPFSVALTTGSGTNLTTVASGTIDSADLTAGSVDLTNASGVSVAVNFSSASLTDGTQTVSQSYGSNVNTNNFLVTGANAIATVTNAISNVASIRGTLGAYQNELTDISNNESVMTENLQASNAQIQDTNMASEMVSFTQDQILVQAGVSMLSQANSVPQYVLKLIG